MREESLQATRTRGFGTVVDLTQNACNFVGDDGKTCRSNNLAFIGRSTPGSDNAGFPKKK